ncbi:MAG: circularly permuted type 2 ATP-grasp protein [Opitutaceae bacterium]|jgi:uncharacterized circularly permuted ATP-grasp superfamily protein/uncharacterized alpha-E superfamily protein|nr:circularly permuted type 2 ATP-grasp protein [Opitutaceae bacterium]
MPTSSATTLPSLHPAQRRTLRPRLRLSIRDASLTDLSHPDDASGRAANHFWKLEPTPLVLSAEEWAVLEAGLGQRARLVNALLVDLYGGQQALREKLLPPEAVLSDPFYRRPCLGLDTARANPAALLRFDLVRTAEGWRCIQTRANTPIGLSYAVQNRRFMTQEAGDLYRALPDYHSAINFPLQLLATLNALAPADRPVPSIIVLTAGPGDAFYSEHSFLARKMGLPLARGDDLIVLDNTVYFKTVAGLERVDVIYRRLNDAHIDPVVFSTDRETAGIPGLLQCIRAGRVALANAIGTGLAESRVIEAYLPRLCRYYLNEKLLLPAPETYACGDTDRLEQILDQRERFTIHPAHESPDNYTVARPAFRRPLLTSKGLDRVVRQNPHAFVARAHPDLLALDGRRPTRAHPVGCLSTYVLTHARRTDVFPGGLVRLGDSQPPSGRVGETADCLVLLGSHNSGGVADLESADPGQPPRRHTLGSRAAENLFWLGRYLERAESTARMLAILDDVALEEIPARDRKHWLPVWRGLLEATGQDRSRLDARARPDQTLGAELAWRLTLEGQNPSSIASTVNFALYNAGQLRDYVSPEAWRVLTRLNSRLDTLRHRHVPAARGSAEKARQLLAAEAERIVLEQVPAFHATADHTMLHDAAWHFLRLGVLLERAIITCSALRHVLGAHARPDAARPEHYRDNPELSALLRMLGSQDAYRRLYQSRSQPRYVAEFFLQQPNAPHGLFHLVHEIKNSLLAIRQEHDPSASAGVPEQSAHQLLLFLLELKPARHFAGDPSMPPFEKLLSEFLERLYALYPVFNDHHFSHQARLAPAESQSDLPL